MKRLENQPAITAILCVILVGAIAVTVLRIKGSAVTAAGRTAAEAPSQTAARSGERRDSRNEPNLRQRDPFQHALLFMNPDTPTAVGPERFGPAVLPGTNDLPLLPMTLPDPTGLKLASMPAALAPAQSPTVQNAYGPAAEPGLRLQAVVWGAEPLAVIKDAGGKSHFVRIGDCFGEGCEVARIEWSRAVIRQGETLVTLRLGGGSEAHEHTDE